MSPMETQLVLLALERMFRPTAFFDIVLVRTACDLAGVVLPKRTEDTLRLMHCVHWSEMPPDARQAIFDTVTALFAEKPLDLSPLQALFAPPVTEPAVAVAPVAVVEVRLEQVVTPKRGFFARLTS